MSSFFGKLRANASSASPSIGSSPSKKDPNHPPLTPLEKLLLDAGPIRTDGSDKFFGMENFGNTCYCNSILQCLYYSVPFREQVISYPKRSPLGSAAAAPGALSKINTTATPLPNGSGPLSPTKPKTPSGPSSARNPAGPPAAPKPDDKDSPEYKKKQAMLAGPVLSMNYDNAASYGMPESLFTSLKDIFEALIANESRTGVVSPTKFLEVLRKENEMFRTAMHQDAHEFLNLLLNEVVTNVETNSKKIQAEKAMMNGVAAQGDFERALAAETPNTTGTRSPSNTGWVHELFEGTLTSETKCLTCENISQRDEAFLDLSVDLDQHSSVTSCLRKFSEEEMLCERNKFHCDKCGGLQEAEKRMKIKRLPKILALHLKRFKYTEDLQRLQKLFHRVVYPYHLRLFNTTDDAEDPDRLYELYAVVVHIGGGPYHGHYVSIIKTQDRGWLLFDDEMVEPVDKTYVRNFFGDRPGLACAYVLFYQETTIEAVKKEQEAEGLAAAEQSTTAPISKEHHGLGLNLKGNFAHVHGNGLHHTTTTASPLVRQELDPMEGLNRSNTAPALTPQYPPPIPETPSMATRVLNAKKSDVQFKKEQAKESKERKAAEKEREKIERARTKELETKRKSMERKQASDLRAAADTSKNVKLAEEKRPVGEANGCSRDGHANGHSVSVPAGGFTALPAIPTSTLSRFRHSSRSMSLSKKPKFWGSSKDGAKEAPKEPLQDLFHEESQAPSREESAVDDGEEHALISAGPPLTPDKPEKKHFFGIRRKASALIL